MSFIRGGSGTGPASKFGTEWIIDGQRGSQRSSLSPWDYSDINGNVSGYYGVAQASGATVSLAAAAHLASLRNSSAAMLLVLLRIKVGFTVNGAITAATQMDLQAVLARAFTADFTTNSTAASLSSGANRVRGVMATSVLGATGPRIATTAAMSGQTLTADANPFAMTAFTNQPSGNATVTQAVGVGHPMVSLYELTPGYQHPIILAANEGVLIQPVTTGPVTGSIKYYVQWEWAELASF